MKNEITVLHAEQIAPKQMTNVVSLRSEKDFPAYLQTHLGSHCICEFSISNGQSRTLEGVLQEIGKNYLSLYKEDTGTTIAFQYTSLLFISFPQPSFRP